jgi:putative heme-binding domain-containing protein
MIAEDPWFMGVALHLGPDGSVFVSDWSDTGECHSTRNTRKQTGRIYKIRYEEPEMPELELEDRSGIELARLAISPNRFIERHARRILQERSVGGGDEAVHDFFRKKLGEARSPADRLKALWGLHVTGGLDDRFLAGLSGAESVEAWAIRLACEDGEAEGPMWDRILDLSGRRVPPRLQRYLISATMRLPPEQRWPVVDLLTARNDYPDDRNIPLLLWYLTATLFDDDPDRFAALVKSPHSFIGEHVARRVAGEPGHSGVPRLIEIVGDHPDRWKGVFTGILAGLEGTRDLEMPAGWPDIFAKAMKFRDEDVRKMAIELALIFDDPGAMRRLWEYAGDPRVGSELRNHSLRALISKRVGGLDSLLLELLEDEGVRRTAILGLSAYDHPDTPERILAEYAQLNGEERRDALSTLASRGGWAGRLLDAVGEGRIPSQDVTAFTARQMVNLGNGELSERVRHLWGELRQTTKEKEKKMASLKKSLRPDLVAEADPRAGRVHFQNLCSACHKLFGEGGEVGPELTGSQRNNLDYLLENLVDPSASVSKDFQMQVIETTNGRIVSGFAESESDTVLVIRSINERVVIPMNEIAKRTVSEDSIMPEGLLGALSTRQKCELIAYLSSPHQVPLKPE